MVRNSRWMTQGLRGIWLACVLGGTAWSQQKPPPATPAKDLVRQAYAKTESAKSQADLAQIIQLCQQAERGELSPALQAYVRQLTAWTHNRRGELHAQEGAALATSGQLDQAKKADQSALSEFETAVQLQADYWKARHNRGVSYALAGKVDEAIADFTRVIELQPSFANALFNRGEIYFDRGQFAEALQDYDAVLRLQPEDHEATLRRGHARFHLSRYADALQDYNHAVELKPDHGEALAYRADAYRILGQWTRAEADYRRARELDDTSVRAFQGSAWLLATCPEAGQRNRELALEYAEKALALAGRADAVCLETLAAAYANAGEFDKARQKMQAAIKIARPDQAAILKQRLSLYEAQKPFREQPVNTLRPKGTAP
jgi:tetratricopeptide (TPR) repeat protein